MQRYIPVLAIALVLQLALSAALGMRQTRLAPKAPDVPLVSTDIKVADHLLLDGPLSGEQAKSEPAKLEIVKRNGHWILPGYYDAPANAGRVDGLLERLAKVKRGFPIATTESALERFKVAENKYERRIVPSANGKALATVYLGSSQGVHKADARTAADKAVYSVELATYDLPTEPARWIDEGLLDRDAASLTEIDVSPAGKPALVLRHESTKGKEDKGGDTWGAPGLPSGKRLDEKQALALASAIGNLKVDEILGIEAKPEWQQDPPALALTLKDKDNKTVSWTLFKPAKDDYYVLKTSDRPWYLQLKTWNARPLLDAATEEKLLVAANSPAGGASASATGRAPTTAANVPGKPGRSTN